MLGLRGLDERVRGRATLLADGDTFYTADIVNRFARRARGRPLRMIFPNAASLAGRAKHNAVFCFHDTQPKPIYSYCRLKDDGSNLILETKEKIKISDWANSAATASAMASNSERECDALLRAGETQLSQDKVGEEGVSARELSREKATRSVTAVEPAAAGTTRRASSRKCSRTALRSSR